MNPIQPFRIYNRQILVFLLVFSASNTRTDAQTTAVEVEDYGATTNTIGLQVSEGSPECNGTGKIDWVPPERLKQWFPVYRLSTDDDGLAVYLSLNGRFNFNKLVDEGTEEEKEAFDKYFDDMMDKFVWDDKTNGGNGVISIVDWDGFSIRNYARPAVIRLAVKQFVKLGKIYNALKQKYSVNTETYIYAAKSQLGKIFEKVEVYETQREKWIPQLRRSIPPRLLPIKYGGTNENIDLQ